MMKKRENFKTVILEPAKSLLEQGRCPSCGKPKEEWNRRKDWACCSTECTDKFCKGFKVYSWPDLRIIAFERDKYTCVRCGAKPKKILTINTEFDREETRRWYDHIDFQKREGQEVALVEDDTKLIGDHIVPIAIGGDEWDLENVQTLCTACNKIKTREDHKKIAEARRTEKTLSGGQTQLNSPV